MKRPLAICCLLTLVACSSATQRPGETLVTNEPPVAPSNAAYVVYYANATLVLPTSPEREARTMDGLLVQNDDASITRTEERLVYVRLEDRVPSDLRCGCASQPGACRLDVAPLLVRAFHAPEATFVTWNEMSPEDLVDGCTCFTTEAQQHMEEAYDGECGEFEEEARAVSLIGGELHVEVRIGESGCDGVVEPEVDRYGLFPDALGVVTDDSGQMRCLSGVDFEPGELASARRISCEAAGEDEDEDDGGMDRVMTCEACEDATAPYQVLSRGRIFSVSSRHTYEVEATAVRSERATHETCPDPSDPCGDPSGLPIPAGAHFWIARDGASALVYQGDRWLVLSRGRTAAAAIHIRPFGHPIGVRYHPDVRPMLAEMDRGALVDASDAMPTIAEQSVPDGDRCDTDEDCLRAGICGGYCNAQNTCMEYGQGCDDEHECEESSLVCQLDEGACVEPDTIAPSERDHLAREDVRYARTTPTDHGRGWARRCHTHLGRGRLDEAYAACVRAIALDPTDRVMSGVLADLQAIWSRRRRFSESDAFENYASMYDESAAEEEEAAPPPPPRRPRRQR